MKNKICISCGDDKHIDNFSLRMDTKKYRNQCKDCINNKSYNRKKNRRKYDPEFVKTERAYCKRWREDNPEYDSKRKKQWRQENPNYDVNYYEKNRKHIVEQKRMWRENNPSKIKKINKRYRQNHPEIKRTSERKRRAIKRCVDENYLVVDEKLTYKLFDNKCFNCDSVDNLTIDHNLCLSSGNALTIQNAVLLCRSCNSRKGSKLPEEFYSLKQLVRLNNILDNAIMVAKEDKDG